jgi:chromosome segregation ATPase
MKPPISSRKKLKKLEEDLQLEQNRLKLMSKYREGDLEGQSGEPDEVIEEWNGELQLLADKLRDLREKTTGVDETGVLKSELDEKDAHIRELEATLKGGEKELEALEKRISRTVSESEKMRKKSEGELENAVKTKEKELKNEAEHAKKLETTLRRREAELRNLEMKKNQLEAESKDRKKEYESTIKALRTELTTRESDVEGLKKKLEDWHASLKDELDAAIEFISQQAEEIRELKAELGAEDAKPKERDGLLSSRELRKNDNPDRI